MRHHRRGVGPLKPDEIGSTPIAAAKYPDASGEETAFIRLSGRVSTALRDQLCGIKAIAFPLPMNMHVSARTSCCLSSIAERSAVDRDTMGRNHQAVPILCATIRTRWPSCDGGNLPRRQVPITGGRKALCGLQTRDAGGGTLHRCQTDETRPGEIRGGFFCVSRSFPFSPPGGLDVGALTSRQHDRSCRDDGDYGACLWSGRSLGHLGDGDLPVTRAAQGLDVGFFDHRHG